MPKKSKLKPKTKTEIKAEIEALRFIKPKVRRVSFFGDDNHARIDAEILVLEKDMTEDQIYERFENKENSDDCATLDSALDARRWMDGDDEDGGLAENWKAASGLKKEQK